MNRINEISSSNARFEYWAPYAGSTHTLQTFMNRINQISSSNVRFEYWAPYAGSTHTL